MTDQKTGLAKKPSRPVITGRVLPKTRGRVKCSVPWFTRFTRLTRGWVKCQKDGFWPTLPEPEDVFRLLTCLKLIISYS